MGQIHFQASVNSARFLTEQIELARKKKNLFMNPV